MASARADFLAQVFPQPLKRRVYTMWTAAMPWHTARRALDILRPFISCTPSASATSDRPEPTYARTQADRNFRRTALTTYTHHIVAPSPAFLNDSSRNGLSQHPGEKRRRGNTRARLVGPCTMRIDHSFALHPLAGTGRRSSGAQCLCRDLSAQGRKHDRVPRQGVRPIGAAERPT